MIIGIYGLKQSGKDFTANIIRWLISMEDAPHVSLSDFTAESEMWRELASGTDVVKFAGKLKQMVSLMIGCEPIDLEDEEFKRTPLPSKWQTPGMPELTPRTMLQKLGTDLIRDNIHVNSWVNATMADYTPDDCWVITDMRFPNEMEAVKEKGGITIHVKRTCVECGLTGIHDENCSRYDNHPSEVSLLSADFDYVVENGAHLSKLISQVRKILIANNYISK